MADRQEDSSGKKTTKRRAVDSRRKVVQLVPKALRDPSDSESNLEDKIFTLLQLGDAERDARNLSAMREAFLEAAEIARRLPRPDLLIRAALGMSRNAEGGGQAVADYELMALLQEALAILSQS